MPTKTIHFHSAGKADVYIHHQQPHTEDTLVLNIGTMSGITGSVER